MGVGGEGRRRSGRGWEGVRWRWVDKRTNEFLSYYDAVFAGSLFSVLYVMLYL